MNVELFLDDAWFHPCPTFVGVHFEDSIQVFRVVDDNGVSDGLAGQTRATPPGQKRSSELVGYLGGGKYVFRCAGDDDPNRFNLVDAGVGAVEQAGGTVETDFTGEGFLQPMFQISNEQRSLAWGWVI